MSSIQDRVSRWLKQAHHIIAPLDWLEACISWIEEEHGQNIISRNSDLNNLVLEQWLLADLKETGASCLPNEMLQVNKYILQGSFCLQVNSVKDVSSSYYSQLQKVQGTENENVQVSATQFSQWNNNQEKSSRMLMVDLTDGTIDIKGLEYELVPDLNVNMKIGSKIIIHGDVLCRLGVLMLKRHNVAFLGGEVDSIDTSQEVVLKNELCNKETFKQNPQTASFKGSGQFVKRNRKVVNNETGFGPSINMSVKSNNEIKRQHNAINNVMDVNWDEEMDDDFLLAQTNIPDGTNRSLSNTITESVPSLCQNNYQRSEKTLPSIQINNSNTHNGSYNCNRQSSDVMLPPSSSCVARSNVSSIQAHNIYHSAVNSNSVREITPSSFNQVSHDSLKNHMQHTTREAHHVKIEEDWDTDFMFDTFDEMSDAFTDNKLIARKKEECSESISYIIQVHPNQSSLTKQSFKVKAYISTLLSKLDFNNGHFWSLFVKLNDGSGVIDVSISNDVLCGLIGYSAEECLEIKTKGQKQDKLKLAQGLRSCQEHLIQMSPILELEVGGGLDKPCVRRIIDLSDEHMNLFSM